MKVAQDARWWAWRWFLACVLGTVLSVGPAGPVAAAPWDTTLVHPTCGSVARVAISADGRFVAFPCVAESGDGQVFVTDVSTRQTTLVSHASGVDGEEANASSLAPSISADGRFVAFWSKASNLTADDSDHQADVFVGDLVAGTTTLVSRATGAAGAKGNDDAFFASPSISADGQRVAFEPTASNLAPADHDHQVDVFVRDLGSNQTTLVSRASGRHGAKSNSGSTDYYHFSSGPALSGDGRFVAFPSNATNLGTAKGNSGFDIFVRDLTTARTTLATPPFRGERGAKLDGPAYDPAISADGRVVAFRFCFASVCKRPMHIFARDLRTHTTTLISRASGQHGAIGHDEAWGPSVSADGKRVAFNSYANNLTPGTTTGGVFVRDLSAQTTTLASRATGENGAPGFGLSAGGAISGDGRFVAFLSAATALTPDSSHLPIADSRHAAVFIRELPGAR